MIPRTTFFNGDILIDKTFGDTVSLLAYDKYNNQSYLKKELSIKKAPVDAKKDHTIKILCLGDNLINDKTAFYVNDKLTSLGVKPKMLGTMLNGGEVYGEGRDGWFYSTFVGASGRGQQEGRIDPQVSKNTSSILKNPFIRIANADDKANYPNDCYRATGAYVEKSYYNESSVNDKFYIFDFANYLEVQGIETPDVVVIAIKPELCSLYTEDIVSTNMMYMRQLVNGIRTALPDTNIVLIPQYAPCTYYDEMWETTSKMVSETIKFVDSLEDENVKVLSAWLHMNSEFGTKYTKNTKYDSLYEEFIKDQMEDQLSETAKIELANAITSYIMNI
jgi:dsDNA-binding SOS-regulon protein